MRLSFKKRHVAREGTLICVDCGRREPIPEAPLDAALAHLAERTAHETLFASLALFGLCPDCRLKEPRP